MLWRGFARRKPRPEQGVGRPGILLPVWPLAPGMGPRAQGALNSSHRREAQATQTFPVRLRSGVSVRAGLHAAGKPLPPRPCSDSPRLLCGAKETLPGARPHPGLRFLLLPQEDFSLPLGPSHPGAKWPSLTGEPGKSPEGSGEALCPPCLGRGLCRHEHPEEEQACHSRAL